MVLGICKWTVLLIILFVLVTEGISAPISFGQSFNSRVLSEEEKNIAERDYLSIMNKCNERLQARADPGSMCDAFMGYYIQQCEKMDDLISYCGISLEKLPLNSLVTYEAGRLTQQGCLNHDKIISESLICEEHISTLGSVAEGYKRIANTHINFNI